MAKDKTPRKSRATRVDSKEEAVRTFTEANKIIVPPDDLKLDNAQTKIFSEIIDEFAKIDWTPHTIRLAALLARTVHQVGELQEELIDEGYVGETARGGPCLNPKVSAMNMLSSQILAQRRSLALHAVAGANKGDVGNRRRHRKRQEDDAPDNEDDLLNTPDG